MDLYKQFKAECCKEVQEQALNEDCQNATSYWNVAVRKFKYCYHFEWLGRPIIQYPQDIVGMQELIWEVKPDLIIETGIAHGGSLIFSASMLALLEVCEASEKGQLLDLAKPKRHVLGVDIDIRKHNRQAIEQHPLSSRIQMIEGSSVDDSIVAEVARIASNYSKVLVLLDSNHTHEHVLAELQAYSPLVSSGSYCVVFDSIIEDMPDGTYPNRPWGIGDNPKTAVREFLSINDSFEVDFSIENKLLITVAPNGWLRKVK